MTEAESRTEFINGEPFVIRGHHLPFYTNIVMGKRPSREARKLRFFIERDWRKALRAGGDIDSKSIKYRKDVLGTTLEQADNFEKNMRRSYQIFLNLPDDYPAIIEEGIPDAICAGCAIGEHCRKRFNNDYHNGITTFLKDVKYVTSFLQRLNRLNLPTPNITLESAFFSDAIPQEVRRATTTIGTIKRVLEEGPLPINPKVTRFQI